MFCAGCFSLGKQLNTFINFKHKPADCTRQGAVSRLLQADGEDYPADDADEDFYDDGKANSHEDNPTNLIKLQNDQMPAKPEESSQHVANLPSNFVSTKNINGNPGETYQSSHSVAHGNLNVKDTKTESHFSETDDLVRKIQNIAKRKHLWSVHSVRKECSPMVSAQLKSETCTPTIDEGSEINCIDANFATKSNLL